MNQLNRLDMWLTTNAQAQLLQKHVQFIGHVFCEADLEWIGGGYLKVEGWDENGNGCCLI